MGENGAGKSTLIKVLTGVYPRDAGDVTLDGHPINPHSTLEAQKVGISTVYQEVNLVPGLSVAENIFLGRAPMRFGSIHWSAINRGAAAALARLDVSIDVTRPLNSYSIAIQQMVALARALDVSAKVLILDEPTSSLDEGEVQRLFDAMRKLKAQGLGIVFVTHFMDQVYAVSDRITVLRNGKLAGEYLTCELPRLHLIARMMGKEVAEVEAAHGEHLSQAKAQTTGEFLKARGLGRSGAIYPFDLDIGKGEVVGLAGLLGSGRTEIARLLFGADASDSGTLEIDGEPVSVRNPRKAIALGIGFCPEDRKVAAIVPDLSVRENIILVIQAQRGWLRRIPRRKQQELADQFIKALRIKTPDSEKAIKFLSGGNQQKAILARWLAYEPRLLILDEPTRGIDVGAKFEIAKLIETLRAEGMALLFISSELEEVVRSSSRVVVLRDRHVVGELKGSEITEERIMATIAAPAGSAGASVAAGN